MKRFSLTLKEVITSGAVVLIAVFLFRGFVAEGMVIPTGSMADYLRGAHFHLTCSTCGYEYNFNYTPQNYLIPGTGQYYPEGYRPRGPVNLAPDHLRAHNADPICPMCGTPAPTRQPHYVVRGDQIWVLKYIYQFFEPRNWDVVVIKSPLDPGRINFIKRLIGLPGQTVEVIDGDIYINGKISRKPDRIQETLWIPVFDNDYQPEDGQVKFPWQQPFQPAGENGVWKINPKERSFEFTGSHEQDSLVFISERINKFAPDFNAYNGGARDPFSVASDLKLSFLLTPQSENGRVSIMLGKYDRIYEAQIDFRGTCTLINLSTGEIISSKNITSVPVGHSMEVSFANVDHRLLLRAGTEAVEYLGPDTPEEWGYDSDQRPLLPSVSLAGQGGSFILRHIILYRDIHYTNSLGSFPFGQGTEGHPITLKENEFFVMGDNSSVSYDSRFWDTPGKGNGREYPRGIVPREYLIGKPMFVYLPGPYRPHPRIRLAIIPNVGDMRFIY
ncbi:MAG: hypothetical protein JW860_01140 [Sedimentisphaerales bacterium]|nr:hypothetical protein [Sedimentisphaerales bacterium]